MRICIRPLHGAFVLLAIMDIRAHPNEYEQEQKALRKNLERLKAERLAREVAKSKDG